jgi:hypothetical protein
MKTRLVSVSSWVDGDLRAVLLDQAMSQVDSDVYRELYMQTWDPVWVHVDRMAYRQVLDRLKDLTIP